jgi:ERCC4-type nuclease
MRTKPKLKPLNPHLGKLKPYKLPPGMILVIDTREQTHVFTRIPKGLTIVSAKLEAGDYSIQGFEGDFAVERKKLSDLYSYCARERKKTIRKMERFRSMEWVGLAIEEREDDVYFGHPMSKVSPEVVRQALASFRVRYGVHVYMNPKRDNVARWILDSAIKFYNMKRGN